MNLRLLLIATLVIFSSCSSGKDEKLDVADFSADDFPMKWELAEMSTMLAGSYTAGEDLPYSESYVFNQDLTFTKTRLENGNRTEASGIYSRVTMDDGDYYKLEYTASNDLVENCSSSESEFLRIESSAKLVGTASACDYPHKNYRRIE